MHFFVYLMFRQVWGRSLNTYRKFLPFSTTVLVENIPTSLGVFRPLTMELCFTVNSKNNQQLLVFDTSYIIMCVDITCLHLDIFNIHNDVIGVKYQQLLVLPYKNEGSCFTNMLEYSLPILQQCTVLCGKTLYTSDHVT